jgi:DNA invertase Pin-like site-specific DNA recombinase
LKELYDILKPAIKKELEERDILLLEVVNKLLKEELKSRTVVTEKTLIKQLNVSRQTLSKWRREGKIPYYRINGSIRYNIDEVLALFRVNAR